MLNRIRKFFSAEPEMPQTRVVGRNEPCHCGSQKKYKNCCLAKDQRKSTR